nr:hypothetical protein GCM10025732_40780 [Glycomyces mayteni]
MVERPRSELDSLRLRPSDLAREHGLTAQAVRNYERDGFLPPAERTRSGYRVYTGVHAAALRAFLALVRAYGHAVAGEAMHAVHSGRIDEVLMVIDRGHEQLLRDRATLDAVTASVARLAEPEAPERFAPFTVGELGYRLRVTPATLRNWERAGILSPRATASPGTGGSSGTTCATPSWRTCCGAAGTRWSTSRRWYGRCGPRAAPRPSRSPWRTGGGG